MFNGKTHYKWPFSIAMLVYQRVHLLSNLSFYPHMVSLTPWIIPLSRVNPRLVPRYLVLS
jgi:hypothetical protein